jgi:hypothetical protein
LDGLAGVIDNGVLHQSRLELNILGIDGLENMSSNQRKQDAEAK